MKHLEHFHELKSLTRKQKFFLLSLLPVYFMVIGLFLQPIQEIGPGIVRLIKEPDFLITDYFVVGGVGAALINAGALTLMSIGIIYFMGMDMDGHPITSSCLMFGFSLFGKNLLNIWAILAGVYLYARYHKTSMRRYIYIGFYGTSLSPIITQMMQVGNLPVVMRMAIALAAPFHSCAFCTQRVFFVQCGVCRRYHSDGHCVSVKIPWSGDRIQAHLVHGKQ